MRFISLIFNGIKIYTFLKHLEIIFITWIWLYFLFILKVRNTYSWSPFKDNYSLYSMQWVHTLLFRSLSVVEPLSPSSLTLILSLSSDNQINNNCKRTSPVTCEAVSERTGIVAAYLWQWDWLQQTRSCTEPQPRPSSRKSRGITRWIRSAFLFDKGFLHIN